MAREVVPAAEALLDKEIKVLDHGFVRLVDYFGSDQRIVQAARVSYGGGTKTQREDAQLIDYLMRHEHTSPFEHVVLELHCKMPIFIARQWIRHRTARLNEISARYSVMEEEFYLPEAGRLQYQSQDNKQGSADQSFPPELGAEIRAGMLAEQKQSYAFYQDRIAKGLAREVARINLPVGLYTQMYWQMDLHNLFHFLALRLDAHAQWEIRQYAEAVAGIAKAVAPLAYASFERHVLQSKKFSATEIEALNKMLAGEEPDLKPSVRKELEAKLVGARRAEHLD